MKVNSSGLIGAQLDLVVGSINGWKLTTDGVNKLLEKDSKLIILGRSMHNGRQIGYSPSTDWSQGGPIIESEMLSPEPLLDTNCDLIEWSCRNWKGDGESYYGPTPLIAAMRCFVASKLGEEVDIPE